MVVCAVKSGKIFYFSSVIGGRKILILTNRVPYPLKDGGNLAMNAMIEGYHKAGWEVSLLSMNTSRHYVAPEQLKTLFTHLHHFEWVDVDNSLKTSDVVRNFLFSRKPEHAIRFYNEAFKERLTALLERVVPDVVQVESVYLSTYLRYVREYGDPVKVLRVHNLEFQVWRSLSRKYRNIFKRIYLNNLSTRIRNFERESWKEYDLLLAITEKDAHQISRMEPVHDLIVAPFSIDTTNIKPGTDEHWVGYHIGAMDWMANQDGVRWFLERVWPRVSRAMPGFEFYFAGRNMPDDLKRVNMKNVHCMDEVASAETFIADKKILIVPVRSAGGIRVKILEAMAAGKIVISTSAGVRGIEANPREHYLLANRPEDFLKAIKWCLDNKEAAEQMAENARQLVHERYEQDKVIGNVIDEVEKLIKANSL